MKRIFFTCLTVVLCLVPVFAQKTKPWTEWSKKDVEKLLNDSAWGQTQTEGGSEPASTTVITPTNSSIQRTGESGEGKTSRVINYRVRFLTAKPIREAFARMVLLSQQTPSEELSGQLQGFIDRDFGDLIVVAVNLDSADQKISGGVLQAFSRMTAEMLKEKAYLERKDGTKLFLKDYKPPISDGMGAKFIFARTLDGQPFINPESATMRFYVEFNPKLKINMKFKVLDMMYDGKLEY